ncbi:phage tail protein [Thalassotalea sp. 1_MG-2023]|uniref:phage tail protein n=1 Tax=Thalassotalea sp. 1_MG-2023 TaxID=3062680 RepID=UPI0026E28985|nr:phage tail protein [Thalassotalea sp. 1_MG-2023]MDO6426232.1 phage tail protein [Thalassotalea sp. 1_MG-2023]
MKNKLQRLVAHLTTAQYQGRLLAKPGEFDAWIEGGEIEPSSKKINGNGIIAARINYSGVISINPCAAPAELIATYVSFWLQENGEKHESDTVEFSVDKLDDNSVELELTIENISEEIQLIESSTGPFVLNDKKYDFGESSLWIAETFTLTGEIDND